MISKSCSATSLAIKLPNATRFFIGATAACLLFVVGVDCLGATQSPVEVIAATGKSELWLNPGLLSYHLDRERDFNAVNCGLGAEYKFSSVASVTLGTYSNSYNHSSDYVGVCWQPISMGPINIGVVAGGFNGYLNTDNGGWFAASCLLLPLSGSGLDST